MPASEISGDASIAAEEQVVPITPTVCGAVIARRAARRPPSGEHALSSESAISTGWP